VINMLGRRKFIGTLTAGIAASILPAGVLNAAGLVTLREQFADLVDSNFDLIDSSGTLRRARLTQLDDGPEASGLEQFSIVFEGNDLSEGLHKACHPRIGTLRIGLMASGERGPGPDRQRAYFSNFV